MAILCRACMQKKDLNPPPVRTRRGPCALCGSTDEIREGRSAGMNYDYPDNLIPGNPNEPNAVAEREEMEKQ